MIALEKIWSFLKSYWYLPVLIIVALVFRSKTNKVEEIIKAADDSHKKQLDAIEVAEINKKKEKEWIDKEYDNAIKKIEEKNIWDITFSLLPRFQYSDNNIWW